MSYAMMQLRLKFVKEKKKKKKKKGNVPHYNLYCCCETFALRCVFNASCVIVLFVKGESANAYNNSVCIYVYMRIAQNVMVVVGWLFRPEDELYVVASAVAE